MALDKWGIYSHKAEGRQACMFRMGKNLVYSNGAVTAVQQPKPLESLFNGLIHKALTTCSKAIFPLAAQETAQWL